MQANCERDPVPGARRYDCLVISDLHLGSDICQAGLLEEFLEWAGENTHELIINGDIFDDLNFNRLSKRHFACLKMIRRNSDRDDLRLVWVRGNHDGPAEVVGHIVGVEVLDEYIFENDRLRLLVLHGDQFDPFVNNYGLLTEIACGLFYYIQKWAPHHASRYLRRASKKWQRSSILIRDGAVAYAAPRAADTSPAATPTSPPSRRWAARSTPIAARGPSIHLARSCRSRGTRSAWNTGRPRVTSPPPRPTPRRATRGLRLRGFLPPRSASARGSPELVALRD